MVVKKKAFTQNFIREINGSKWRFFSILIIVAIGVAFFAGIRATSPDMLLTCNDYLKENNISDIDIVSYSGFNFKDIEDISSTLGVKSVTPSYKFDAIAKFNNIGKPVVINSYNIKGQNINKLIIVQGRLPKDESECVTEESYLKSENAKLGDRVELQTPYGLKSFKIVGTVNSPRYINSYDRGNNSLGNGRTLAFFQIGEESAELLSGLSKREEKLYNEILVTVNEAQDKSIFSTEYREKVDAVKDRLIQAGKIKPNSVWVVQDNDDNENISGYENNSDRIGAIGKVFPLFFFIIATLVCLTSMTRMVEEHRTQMGSLKALGYSKLTIVSEYFFYSLFACIGGSILGTIIGFKLFPRVIFDAYRIMYTLPTVTAPYHIKLAIGSTLAAVSCTTVAAILACIKELISNPAELLRPKAPKPGKRIFLERIKPLWIKMSFIKKVTARNIFRYKKRFFMTIIGIAGCTALLLTGFGLRDSILSITNKQFNDIYYYNMMAYFNKPIRYNEIDFTKEKLDKYENINKSLILSQKNILVNNDESVGAVYLMVPENQAVFKEFISLKDNNGAINIPEEGVIITEKLSKLFKLKKGDDINIKLGEKMVKSKICGISEHYVGHYIYMSPNYYNELFNEEINYNAFASIINDRSKKAENDLSTDIMKDKLVATVNFNTNISDDFKKSMKGMNSVIWVLISSAAALAFVVMFNLTSININERIRELATIKVLGFYDKEVAEYIFRENVFLSIIGTLVGLVFGLGLHRYVIISSEVEMIMFVRAIKWPSFIYAAILTIVFSGLVNIVMYKRIVKIDMVESLKSGE